MFSLMMIKNNQQMFTLVVNCMALINDFLSLIYPRRCEACGGHLMGHEAFICTYCKLNLPKSGYHHHPNNRLAMALGGRIPLQHAMSFYLFEKSGRVQKLIHAVKYQEQKELGAFLGKLYAEELLKNEALQGIDLVLPIPLHRKKLKARGFNQSEWFAKGLSEGLSRQMDSVSLVRVTETSTQTKKKKYQRWENVEGIFELKDSESLKNKHVLLVDDVITTGATLEAAWLALKHVEGIRLSVASIAFAAQG
jgi:ComF family protein